ncbi:hypothetical protein NC651_005505 [Populus alba x Populus x berolinensis]|nr:hypothetical protein NC651_005505 [Populus alba x Populus x berolinensis]
MPRTVSSYEKICSRKRRLYSTSGRTEQGDCMVFFPVFSIQFLYFLLAFVACSAFSFVKGTG